MTRRTSQRHQAQRHGWLLAGLLASLFPAAVAAQSGARASDLGQQGQQDQPQTPSHGVVNLNTASAEELMRLPGIGPARAAAILALRQRIKHFRRIAAIMRVRGIGRRTLARLRPMLTLEGPTTLR